MATASWYFIVDIPPSDTTPPAITDLQPLNASTINNNYTAISANYSDFSGINISSVILLVDGVDVTSSSVITVNGITYIPLERLSNGSHTIYLEVKDTDGNTATATWSFTVDTSEDEIPSPSKDFLSEYWWLLLLIIIVVIVLIVAILLVRRKKKEPVEVA
jgi:hypothetical protein